MFTDRLIELYGTHTDIQSTKDRYRKVLQAHGAHPLAAKYRESALFSTSGRTELGGNHTDHNRGKVIAASIQLDTIASASTIEIPSVTIVSPGFPDVSIDIADLSVREEEEGTNRCIGQGHSTCIQQSQPANRRPRYPYSHERVEGKRTLLLCGD